MHDTCGQHLKPHCLKPELKIVVLTKNISNNLEFLNHDVLLMVDITSGTYIVQVQ